jgi:hypothetical protein
MGQFGILQLSEAALETLRELRKEVHPGLFRRASSPGAACEILRNLREPAALPELSSLYFGAPERARTDLASLIRDILVLVPATQLPALDSYLRSGEVFGEPGRDPWRSLKPVSLTGLPVEILCIASCHRDGYVRAAALRELDRHSGFLPLCFFLLRANDWVAAVRGKARSTLFERISWRVANDLLLALPLVRVVRSGQRADHSTLIELVDQALLAEQSHAAVLARFPALDLASKEYLVNLAIGSASDSLRQSLIALSTEDANQLVRRIGYRLRLQELPPDRRSAWFAAVGSDRAAAVRHVALQYPPAPLNPRDVDVIRRLVLDRAAGLRAMSRPLWEASGGSAADLYRAALAEGSPVGALLGLGEVGGLDDAARLTPFTTASSPRKRAAAIRSLGYLQGDLATPLLVRSFLVDVPAVARQVYPLLIRYHRGVDHEEAWKIASGSVDGRKRVIQLGRILGKWIHLLVLLRSWTQMPALPVSFLNDQLTDWLRRFNRSAAPLPLPLEQELHTLVRSVASRLSAERARQLAFHLPGPSAGH